MNLCDNVHIHQDNRKLHDLFVIAKVHALSIGPAEQSQIRPRLRMTHDKDKNPHLIPSLKPNYIQAVELHA